MAKKIEKTTKVKGARKPSAKKQAAQAAELAEKETKNYMNDLIKAATEFFQTGTAYFKQNTGTATLAPAPTPAAPAAEAPAAPAAEAPAKRTRRTAAQIAADEAAADPLADLGLPEDKPAAPAPKPLTEKESYDLLINTATEYVGKYGKEKGTAQAKAHLKPYKVEKITALTYEQRPAFIKTLRAELDA